MSPSRRRKVSLQAPKCDPDPFQPGRDAEAQHEIEYRGQQGAGSPEVCGSSQLANFDATPGSIQIFQKTG